MRERPRGSIRVWRPVLRLFRACGRSRRASWERLLFDECCKLLVQLFLVSSEDSPVVLFALTTVVPREEFVECNADDFRPARPFPMRSAPGRDPDNTHKRRLI